MGGGGEGRGKAGEILTTLEYIMFFFAMLFDAKILIMMYIKRTYCSLT